VRTRREQKYKAKKIFYPKKPQHVFFRVFAQTAHIITAPHGFACVGIPATWLYIPSFIEIRSEVSDHQGVKIWPFPLLWLFTFTTACTTVQAVIIKGYHNHGASASSRVNCTDGATNSASFYIMRATNAGLIVIFNKFTMYGWVLKHKPNSSLKQKRLVIHIPQALCGSRVCQNHSRYAYSKL